MVLGIVILVMAVAAVIISFGVISVYDGDMLFKGSKEQIAKDKEWGTSPAAYDHPQDVPWGGPRPGPMPPNVPAQKNK